MGLAELLGDFAQAYPDIHVDLSLGTQEADLRDGGFDLGVRNGTSHDASLISRRIGSASAGVFAAKRYLDARGRPNSVAELAKHDAVLFRGKDQKTLWRFDGPDDTKSSVEVSGRVSGDEIMFVRQAIVSGLGVGLLPLFVESVCVYAKKVDPLERVLTDYVVRGAELTVVTPTGPKRPRRVTLLRDFLVERMSEKCGEPKAPALARAGE
jgi:DNA-binding transcriptional LysR family regulator